MKKALRIFILLLIPASMVSMNEIVVYVDDVRLTVVVNNSTAPSEYGMMELRSILKGEQQRWKDGTKITLAFMKTTTDVGSNMSERIFDMTEKELNKYFLAKVFQGKMTSPEFFESESDLLSYVKMHKGTISVINTTNATGLKTISIDGKKSF